jgi:hypothetical protein
LVEHALLDHVVRRSSTDCGMVNPSAFAVLGLMTSSNFVDCSTGKSAGQERLEFCHAVVQLGSVPPCREELTQE